jgi:hypothetical protein
VSPVITEPAHVRGTISSAAFESGDRFVIGNWSESPIGRLVDVMWVDRTGRRRLLVPSDAAGEFIGAIYRFDEIAVAPLTVDGDDRNTFVRGHGLELELHGGRRRPAPFPRPLWLTRYVEAPLARLLMGVETYGESPTGVREWYQTRGWSWVVAATGRRDGHDLGELRDVERPVGVGFSEPPRRPSIVSVRVGIRPPRR